MRKLKASILALLIAFSILAAIPINPVFASPDTNTWQVEESSDDCFRKLVPDSFGVITSSIWAGDIATDNYDYRAGMRWTNITIPQGDIIVSAYLVLRSETIYEDIPETFIEGEDTDNATTFINATDYDARPRTSASVSWTPSTWGGGAWIYSINIKTIIQEIIDIEEWQSGNAIVLFWRDADGWGGTQKSLGASSWDCPAPEQGDGAPKLEITWIEPEANPPTYSNVGTNTTGAGNPCEFSCEWTDDTYLAGYIFGTNNTGTWNNDTWTAWTPPQTSAWSNVTKVLNSTVGVRVEYCWWANDTSDNWNNTGTLYLITGFYSTSSDGHLRNSGSNYVTVWNATSSSNLDDADESGQIGQELMATTYTVMRSFFFFDTSSIPDDANVTSATLSLYGLLDYSYDDFNITIQNGQPTYPHDPLENADYNKEHYTGNGGTFDTTNFETSAYNNISFSLEGLAWINKTGTTKLCLRSSRDINGIEPTQYEQVWVYHSEMGNGYKPKLIINHHQLSISSVPTSVSFTLNGTSKTTPYSATIDKGTYQINFASSFSRAGLTWIFGYWNDDTSNTNPNRTIDLQSDTSLSVTYTSTYEPITYTGYEPVFECAMNNMFELNGILEGNDTYRQMLLDSSIYENHGKIYPLDHPYAGPELTWGRMGKALEFDGVDDTVIVSSSDSLNFSDAVTIEFWFMVYNATPSQRIINKKNATTELSQFTVGVENEKLLTAIYTTSGNGYLDATSSENISVGVFYFFSLTYDYRDGYYTVYLHGIPQFNVTTDGNKIRNADSNIYLGSATNSSHWFNGVLDEVRIFPYKRLEAEIYTDARTPISRFDSWSFVNSGTSPDGEDWTVVEGTTSGYQGFKGNDPALPWAYANDTNPYTFVRTIRYMAGFQSYQLYCNVKLDLNAVPSERENYIVWYWSFFKNGRLQVTYDIMIKPYAITLTPEPYHAIVSQWYVYFRRTTPYLETTELVDAYIDVNTTLFQNSIPVIVSAWVGPDNKRFSCRIDFQDERVSTESGIDFPYTYSFDLVDENLNTHVVQWFDGWVVAGIKVKAHSSFPANSWAKMEIESHRFLGLLVALTIIIVVGLVYKYVIAPWLSAQLGVSEGMAAVLKPISDLLSPEASPKDDPITIAIDSLKHAVIGKLSEVIGALGDALAPLWDWLAKIGSMVVNAFISFMEPVLTALANAGMAIVEALIGLIDGVFGFFGFPGGFTQILTFIGSLWAFLVNAFAWVVSSLTSIFLLLPSFMFKALNTVATAAGIFLSMFTWFWWVLDSAHGGAQSLWLTIRLDLWVQLLIILYPVYLLWKWDEEGLDAVINHIKMVLDIMAWIVNMLITVIQTFITIIDGLIEKIPIIE